MIANGFLLVFICYFYTNTNGNENRKFIRLEIASWVLGSFSAITLILSTLYTSWVLRKLYGSDFSSTSFFMLVVLAIFCMEFFSRTVYEWVMFHFYHKNPQTVINMMQVMTVFMPFFWDLMPITTVLVLHSQNYSRKAETRDN